MSKTAVKEATAVTERLLDALLAVPVQSATDKAADFRRAVGELRNKAEAKIADTSIADDLVECFDLAFDAGVTVDRYDSVRLAALAEAPSSLIAKAIAIAVSRLALIGMCRVIATTTFRSRQDIEALLGRMNTAFEPAEEQAASLKEQEAYRALLSLHGALTRDLMVRSKPLPRMTTYTLGRPFPALRLAQILHADPSRAEELRQENKVPHPLFMPISGRALSA
jgi:prophage DNA circulation protein